MTGGAVSTSILVASLLAIGLLAGCDAQRRVTEGSLRVVSSDAAYPLIRAEADTFSLVYASAEVVTEGGGSVRALEALINRQADLAVISREPTEHERQVAKEIGVEVGLFPFARDGLAILVHRDNPVYALSFDEAAAVLSGATRDWDEVGGNRGPIMVYKSSEGSGAVGYVRQVLLENGPLAPGAVEVASTSEVVDSVAANRSAIGFAGMAELDERVKALPLSAPDGGPLTPLNAETVYRQTYPLTRTFYLATRGIPRDDLVSGFVSFVMATRGQRIVMEAGLVPATVPLRIRHEG